MGLITEDNPLGIAEIDHLEFTCHDLATATRGLFIKLGFQLEQAKEYQELFVQGQVRFLLNANPQVASHPRRYFDKHGEGVCKISFLVEDAEHALDEALRRGASQAEDLCVDETDAGLIKRVSIQGFGDVLNEFVERPKDIFRVGFTSKTDPQNNPLHQPIARIDHLTNNVPKGEMEKWVEFYQKIYGFKVTRYFDIKGLKTGLESKVVQLANGRVIIPINEPDSENSKSQIQEFLDRHNGPGVQHIALTTGNIIKTISELRSRDIKFLDIPSTYYEDIPKRDIPVKEDLDILESNQILVDGDQDGYLLQIFSDTYIGPLFFEYIQRKKHNGFGEGNFQALFDAIERDQVSRGYLNHS